MTLREVREKYGLSQEDVSEIMGWGRSYCWSVEKTFTIAKGRKRKFEEKFGVKLRESETPDHPSVKDREGIPLEEFLKTHRRKNIRKVNKAIESRTKNARKREEEDIVTRKEEGRKLAEEETTVKVYISAEYKKVEVLELRESFFIGRLPDGSKIPINYMEARKI